MAVERARSRGDDWGVHGGVVATRREFSVRDSSVIVQKTPANRILEVLVGSGGRVALLRLSRELGVTEHHIERRVPVSVMRSLLADKGSPSVCTIAFSHGEGINEEDWGMLRKALCPSDEPTIDGAEMCCVLSRSAGNDVWESTVPSFRVLDEGLTGKIAVSRLISLGSIENLLEDISDCCGPNHKLTLSDFRNLFAGICQLDGVDFSLEVLTSLASCDSPIKGPIKESTSAPSVPPSYGRGVLRGGRGYVRAYGLTPCPLVFIGFPLYSLNSSFLFWEDVSIDGDPAGRMIIELAAEESPRTVENFRCLCTGEKGISPKGVRLWFKGLRFHRIVRNFIAQSGDVVYNDGRGGASIYGRPFDDEPSSLSHSSPGILSMVNTGPDTNQSQWFLTTAPAAYLDGRFVSFGRLTEGMETLMAIERCGDDIGRPTRECSIVDCGQLQ